MDNWLESSTFYCIDVENVSTYSRDYHRLEETNFYINLIKIINTYKMKNIFY